MFQHCLVTSLYPEEQTKAFTDTRVEQKIAVTAAGHRPTIRTQELLLVIPIIWGRDRKKHS